MLKIFELYLIMSLHLYFQPNLHAGILLMIQLSLNNKVNEDNKVNS